MKQDLFSALDYWKSKEPPALIEGRVTSVKDGVSKVAIGGSQQTIDAYYNSRHVDVPVVGDFAICVRVNKLAQWRILQTYGSPALGTVVASSVSLQLAPPYRFDVIGMERFAFIQWDAPPQQFVTYELQASFVESHADAQTFAIVGGSNYLWEDTHEAWFRCRSINVKFQTSSWTDWLHYTGGLTGSNLEYIRFPQGDDTILQGGVTSDLLTLTLPVRAAVPGEYLTSTVDGALEWETPSGVTGVVTVTDTSGSPTGDVGKLIFWDGGVSIAGSEATISPKLLVVRESDGFPSVNTSILEFDGVTLTQPDTNTARATINPTLTVRDVDSTFSMQQVHTLIGPNGMLVGGGTGVAIFTPTVLVQEQDGSPAVNAKKIEFPNASVSNPSSGVASITFPTGNLTVKDYTGSPSYSGITTIETQHLVMSGTSPTVLLKAMDGWTLEVSFDETTGTRSWGALGNSCDFVESVQVVMDADYSGYLSTIEVGVLGIYDEMGRVFVKRQKSTLMGPYKPSTTNNSLRVIQDGSETFSGKIYFNMRKTY